MTISTGVAKTVAVKKETVFGTAAGAAGAKYVRRVSSSIDLTKATYESAEIRTDYQVADMRHGGRTVGGDIKGELSPGTYADFFASLLRAPFAAPVGTGAIATVAALAGPPATFTRSAGSFITDGFQVGDIVRWSDWLTTGTGNNSKNFRITALSATVMTVSDLAGPANTSTVATKIAGDSVTGTVVGKRCSVPQTGHTNESWTIEHAFNDVSVFEQFTGCRVSKIALDMPSTGMSSITISFMGQDMTRTGVAYFTTPTASGSSGVLAAVNGKLSYNGVDSAIVTSLSLSIDGGMTVGTVVGSNITPDVFAGRVKVTGTLSAYFADAAIADDFLNEATPSLSFALSTDSTSGADFFGVTLPKIKLGSATRTDGEAGLTLSASFTALLPSTASSTIYVQDSLA